MEKLMQTDPKRIIKKYPNRRLYDTTTSCYITLEDVKQLVMDKIDVEVLDAKSGEDITHTVLLQIILEAESLGKPLLTYDLLTQLIRFYGNAMQGMVGGYLEKNLAAFMEMQQRFLDQGKALYGKDFSVNTAVWEAFLTSQLPTMQDMLNTYVAQSTDMMSQMQNQWYEQTKQMLQGFSIPFSHPFMGTSQSQSSGDNHSSPQKDTTKKEHE